MRGAYVAVRFERGSVDMKKRRNEGKFLRPVHYKTEACHNAEVYLLQGNTSSTTKKLIAEKSPPERKAHQNEKPTTTKSPPQRKAHHCPPQRKSS